MYIELSICLSIAAIAIIIAIVRVWYIARAISI
jgi:hypothetical protein